MLGCVRYGLSWLSVSFKRTLRTSYRLILFYPRGGSTGIRLDIPQTTIFPLPDNSLSLCTYPLHHHRLPIYNIKRSAVNVYKIDSGRSVRVGNTG